jgi:hypothetical protein
MTPQEFILKWSPIVALSTQNKALSLAFMLEVKQMVDEATKVQQNASQGLITAMDVIRDYSNDVFSGEVAKNAINEYKEATK